MEIRLLGRFAVVVDGVEVPLGGHRQRAVLAALAVHAGEIVSIDRLTEEVWNGRPPATAVTTLQRYVSHLRRALDGLPAAIETQRPGYALRVDAEAIDARRFEAMVDEGRQHLASGHMEAASAVLREALGLWRGDPLADFSEEAFAGVEKTRLEEMRLTAVELRIDADLALGLHRDLVPELEALVAAYPLRESYRGQLMRALHGAGRRADALRLYTEGRRLLAEELGLDPSTGLQRLEQAILLHDPAVEPPPARAGGRVGRLPAEQTSFVGRQAELREVAECMARARLVTLTGVGGSGKSRLALRVATERAPSFPGGAWLVELAGVTDPATVPRVVARVLGVREEADRDLVDAVVEMLSLTKCLLVVDGCEHLLDAVVPLLERVLAGADDVRILATSREPLGMNGETTFRVPPLPVPAVGADPTLEFDAVRLFVERAQAVESSFEPGPDDIAAIADVCRRLDGLPLALELAAARMDVLTPRQLAERLDQRFELLTDERRSALPRHRTLRATIDWSYALLREQERLLFERLSVFAGSFTVEGAESVCADERLARIDVVDLFGRLVRKSLVVRVDSSGPTPRYRLLDTLREYAYDRLRERGEAIAAHVRHAAYFTDLVERVVPVVRGRGTRNFDDLDAEQVEFTAALAWLLDRGDGDGACRLAMALAPYWDSRHHVRDGRMWLERALTAAATAGMSARSRLGARVWSAHLALLDEDIRGAAQECETALQWLAEAPDDLLRVRVLTIRAEVARNADDLEAAWAYSTEAVALARRRGDAWGEADAQRVLALVGLDRGDMESVERAAAECLRLFQRCGDIEKVAGAQVLLGSVARNRGRFAEAAVLYEQSLAGFQQVGDRFGACFSMWLLSEVACSQGDTEAATRFAEDFLRTSEELRFRRGIAQSYHLLAGAALVDGELERAERLCAEALDWSEARSYTRDTVDILRTAAVIRLRLGRVEEAADLAERGLAQARDRGYGVFLRPLLCVLAAVRVQQGRTTEAVALGEEAVALSEQAGDARGRAGALTALADAAVAEGRGEDATALLDEARAGLAAAGAALTVQEAAEFDRVHADAGESGRESAAGAADSQAGTGGWRY